MNQLSDAFLVPFSALGKAMAQILLTAQYGPVSVSLHRVPASHEHRFGTENCHLPCITAPAQRSDADLYHPRVSEDRRMRGTRRNNMTDGKISLARTRTDGI
jgi:hypothetical protein